MRQVFIIILTLILICGISSAGFTAVEEKEIIAEGMAAGSSPQAGETALNRALRKAIEQGVGVMVDSETLVENYELLEDKIYSEVKGYVKSYEVISDNKGAEGLYKITVKAKVALGQLTKDVKALGIIKEKMGFPRIMVVIDEYVDGIERPTHITESEVEKIFIQNDIPVVSKAQTEKIKERDATLSYTDPEAAAALGRRYGAEVVIIGRAASSLMDTSQPYGVSVFAYKAHADAKAVKTDNAEVLTVISVEEEARGSGRVPTANKALENTAELLAEDMIKGITESWRSEVFNERSIQLIVDNADPDKSTALVEALGSVDEIRDVNERSLVKGVLELDVRYFGDADQLAAFLSGMTEPVIKVTGKTPNRIDCRFVE